MARDEPRQVQRAESFVASGAWVSHLVLAETLWVMESVYGLRHGQIAAAVEMLLHHAQLTLQDSDVVAEALEYFRRAGRLAFSDALIVAIARKNGHVPLGSFDRELARLDDVLSP